MSRKYKKRKHVKARKKRGAVRIFKLLCNTVLGGVTLGLSACLIIVLLPKILPFVNNIKEHKEPVYGSTTVTRVNATPLAQNGGGKDTPDSLRLLKDKDVEDTLAKLAKENEDIAGIYAERSKYPEELLAALAANQEMTDFVKGYLASDGTVTGGISEEEKGQSFPLFLQWDKRWGYSPYGRSSICISGCGPTCLSMVLYYLLGDESLTPDVIADYSMDNGYYMSGTGTAWKLLEDVADMHGLNVWQPKASDRILKEELDKGSVIICSMKPGEFTAGGHFIVIYGYDSEGFLVNDPNCVARSRRRWTYDEIGRQIKNTWVYSAPVRDIHKDTEKDGWG